MHQGHRLRERLQTPQKARGGQLYPVLGRSRVSAAAGRAHETTPGDVQDSVLKAWQIFAFLSRRSPVIFCVSDRGIMRRHRFEVSQPEFPRHKLLHGTPIKGVEERLAHALSSNFPCNTPCNRTRQNPHLRASERICGTGKLATKNPATFLVAGLEEWYTRRDSNPQPSDS